ncbi:MAG: spermidine synthase [Gammaproteobacteria bacterium RBG_16_51_14]|nr:MAG: spermidine synthase [Gammaproteobacteria bacterium RBG_16_51_14]
MSLDHNWFTEIANGYGMSLQVREKIHDEQSPCQHIEVFDTETFGRLLTLDGMTMLTSRDHFIHHEMMTHPALFTHSAPRQVVIVGGGDCGTLKEALKHKVVKQVVQVELDERVTRVAERYFPELCESNGDPRAVLLFEDAIKWMQEAQAGSADIIILDTTEPVGQATRLFGAPFYGDCLRVLRQGGIMVTQSGSPLFNLDFLKGMRKEMNAAGFESLMTIQFSLCTYPSGWWSATLARKNQNFGDFREQNVRRKSFDTRYYNADIHRASQVLPTFLQEALAE